MLANTICLVAQSQTLMAGGLLLVSLSYSGDLSRTIKLYFLLLLQLSVVRQRYLSEEAELVHGMETMQM